MTSPSVDLKALRELLAVVEVDRDTLDLDGLRLWNAAHAQLDMISPTLARTALDQADRLEAITRDNAALTNIHACDINDMALLGLARDEYHVRATLAETALAEARQKLAAIGKIVDRNLENASNLSPRDGDMWRIREALSNLAKDKPHG